MQAQVTVAEQVDAKKSRFGRDEALRLAHSAEHVYVAKGKHVRHFNMRKAPPTDDELAAALLGPTGNLRAPTIRRGKSLFVGFQEAMFREHLT